MKKIFLIMISILCITCTKRTEIENETSINENVEHEGIINDSIELEETTDIQTFFVIPENGLNFRTVPNTTGEIIKILPCNTELIVIERSNEKETIDGIHDYWYKVETEDETGWVFGGYLAVYPVVIKSNGKFVPKFIYNHEINVFRNGNIFFANEAIKYNNRDEIEIYELNNKNSSSFFTDCNIIFLFGIAETPGWYYSITYNAEALGYVYIYDITEKSYYGDFDANEESGNWYTRALNKEFKLMEQYQNISRYGPLLHINHNNDVSEFLDSFNGLRGSLFQLFDYFPEYNEILIHEQFYEGGNVFIYDLISNEIKCEDLAFHHLYFNESRTYLFSLDWSYGGPESPLVKIFKIDNSLYKIIFDDIINGINSVNNISWINDNEVIIDCINGTVQIIIGDTVDVRKNLE